VTLSDIAFRGSKLTKSPSTLPWKSIWKRNNHGPFWICVWGKLCQGNHVIIVTPTLSFSKWKELAGLSNSSGLKSVSVSGKLRFPDRLECMVGLFVKPWSNGLACTCVDLRLLWSTSNLHASRHKLINIWPPNPSQHKFVMSIRYCSNFVANEIQDIGGKRQSP